MPTDVFTLLSDIQYQTETWLPYVYNRVITTAPLITSGIVRVDEKLNGYCNETGVTFVTPYFNPLTGVDQLMVSNSAVSVSNIGTNKSKCIRNIRQTAWGYEDLASAITGADPASAIGNQAATWQTNADAAAMGAVLTGLFVTGGALRNTNHYVGIQSETSAGVQPAVNGAGGTGFNGSNLVVALEAMLGDKADLINKLVVNSGVYVQMQQANLLKNVTIQLPSGVSVVIEQYLGKYTVVVSNAIAPRRPGTGQGAPTVFRTYAFADASIGYGTGLPPGIIAFEAERIKKEAKNDSIYRRGFIIAPYGLTWVGTPANEWPTNDEYATPGNWQISPDYNQWEIPIVAFDTN